MIGREPSPEEWYQFWRESEDLGSLRWFGPSSVRFSERMRHIRTPDQEECPCGDAIEAGDRGVRVPAGDRRWFTSYHLNCWLRSIGLQPLAQKE